MREDVRKIWNSFKKEFEKLIVIWGKCKGYLCSGVAGGRKPLPPWHWKFLVNFWKFWVGILEKLWKKFEDILKKMLVNLGKHEENMWMSAEDMRDGGTAVLN